MEIACISNNVGDLTDHAYWWRACAIQYARDFLPAWKLFLPIPDLVVSGFTDAKDLKPVTHFPLLCLGDLGDPGALGDHSGIRALWQAYGRFLPDSVVLSHEVLELAADPWCDAWKPMPGTDDVEAMEVVDRVEGDTYSISVDIAGSVREVNVSNFLLPSAFGMIAENADPMRFDFLGLLKTADENRGYRILKHPDGSIENQFAATMGDAARARVKAKTDDLLSRAAQRRTTK